VYSPLPTSRGVILYTFIQNNLLEDIPLIPFSIDWSKYPKDPVPVKELADADMPQASDLDTLASVALNSIFKF
jgi:hypothetical protein